MMATPYNLVSVQGIPATSQLTFEPDLDGFIASRVSSPYTVFSGGNNSGKSLLLKNIKAAFRRNAYMMGPSRFYHIFELNTQRYDPRDYDNFENSFYSQFYSEQFNYEQNYIDLGRVIATLGDHKRDLLFGLCEELIGNQFSIQKRDPDNELSPRYIDMDGQNLSVGSTGTRLLMTLLGLCMDEQFSVILIDEPELGLSPRVQTKLAAFLANEGERNKYFPHLSGIYVATHSHLFLDRSNISNNFIVTKEASHIRLEQVRDISRLHQLQFNMLGNALEALYLPAGFVVCEGKSDRPYLQRIVNLHLPDRNLLVSETQGDVKRAVHNLSNALGDIYKSPFRDRLFVVLDAVHTAGTKADLERMGVKPENIVIWENNGIEYVYPPQIISRIFSCGADVVGQLQIQDDNVSMNGVVRRKAQLAEEVVQRMDADTELPIEVHEKLLNPLKAAVGG